MITGSLKKPKKPLKIALVGDFSGLHYNLKIGLTELGHRVTIYGTGDGFKCIPYDRAWGQKISGRSGLALHLSVIQPVKLYYILSAYDVVQFINPGVIATPKAGGRLYLKLINIILKHSRATKSLVVAGCDHFVEKYNRVHCKSLCEGCLQIDQMRPNCYLKSDLNRRLATTLLKRCDLVLPFSCPSYAESYLKLPVRVAAPLQFPIELPPETVSTRPSSSPLTILHGINRPGFKGSNVITAALSKVKEMYAGQVNIIIPERLPITEYKKAMMQADIVIDQLHSDGVGMNALMAMSAGKIVITSFSPLFKDGNVDYSRFPAIKAERDIESLTRQISELLSSPRTRIRELGISARRYVREHCNPRQVAEAVVEAWGLERLHQFYDE